MIKNFHKRGFITHIILVILGLFSLYPTIQMIMISLKTSEEVMISFNFFPHQPQWFNYIKIWREANLITYFRNSIIVTITTVLLVVIISSLGGYAFSRLNFRGKNVLFYLFLSGLMLPIYIAIFPLFIINNLLGLINNYLALIGPYTAFGLPFSLYIIKNYFDTIPREIDESAKIDGCSHIGIWWRIIMPVSKPVIVTVIILQFMNSWNEFFLALIFMTKPEMKTIPLIGVVYMTRYMYRYEMLFTGVVIAVAPIIVLYIILQRQFISGLTAGSVKG